ncbi:hypothetical protein FRB93_010301 [Tulasnella sp. JGI-2019a]|nr:hypothetical protein FRB93_010301 [Tulasnella sp. JGI-2019a]
MPHSPSEVKSSSSSMTVASTPLTPQRSVRLRSPSITHHLVRTMGHVQLERTLRLTCQLRWLLWPISRWEFQVGPWRASSPIRVSALQPCPPIRGISSSCLPALVRARYTCHILGRLPNVLCIALSLLGVTRLVYQTYTTALAAHGYVVIGIDHPYDAEIVEYPDGRLVFAAPLNDSDPAAITSIVETRIKDVQFVLDQVCGNKDLTQSIPVDCGVRKVGMFGHSLGGATTADMTIIDQRIAGGVNLDGAFFPTQSGPDVSPDTPFLVIAAEGHNETNDPTYGDWFKTPTTNASERFIATVVGTKHLTFTDYPILLDVLNFPRSSLPADEAALLGTIDGQRISEIIQVSLDAWFDLILKGEAAGAEALLKHGKEIFPEVDIVQLS